MTELSPSALAVIAAQARERCRFEWSTVNDPPCHPSDPSWNGCATCVDRRGVAAAIRASAEQVTKPEDYEALCVYEKDYWDAGFSAAVDVIRGKLFGIADELDGGQ